MFWSRSKKKCKKSWTQFSAVWKTERQREQEEMERRKKRRAIVRKGSHSGEVLNVPPGKGTIDSLCPIWASVSKQRCCIHLTQKNLLSNFVWDEVTANCKFSHEVENHPAQTRERWRNNKGWAHAFFPQTTAHHASPFLSPPSCYFYIPSSAQWLPFLPSFSLFPPWLPPTIFFFANHLSFSSSPPIHSCCLGNNTKRFSSQLCHRGNAWLSSRLLLEVHLFPVHSRRLVLTTVRKRLSIGWKSLKCWCSLSGPTRSFCGC